MRIGSTCGGAARTRTCPNAGECRGICDVPATGATEPIQKTRARQAKSTAPRPVSPLAVRTPMTVATDSMIWTTPKAYTQAAVAIDTGFPLEEPHPRGCTEHIRPTRRDHQWRHDRLIAWQPIILHHVAQISDVNLAVAIEIRPRIILLITAHRAKGR